LTKPFDGTDASIVLEHDPQLDIDSVQAVAGGPSGKGPDGQYPLINADSLK
jgi:hypothetical protein